MTIVRRTMKQVRERGGQVDRAKVASFTEADITRFAKEDDSSTSKLGPWRYVPRIDVRNIRERLGLSQGQFARRYMLSLRTIQDWEQHRREPSDAAKVLLFAISRNHQAVEKALRG